MQIRCKIENLTQKTVKLIFNPSLLSKAKAIVEMTRQHRKRLIFYWTAPKNLLAMLLFIILTAIIQYTFIASTIPTIRHDSTTFTLPAINITISLLRHVIPISVIVTLTTSFTHLTTYTATIPRKTAISRKTSPRKTHRKSTRLKPLRKFYEKLHRAARKIKNEILKTPAISRIQRRVALAKTLIKSAITILATFIIILLLISIAAYPKLVPTATISFYQWNGIFLTFVVATIKAAENVANTIPPVGVVATAIHNALITAAPTFRNVLEGTASAIAKGLVTLNPAEKYLIIQNTAAWTVAIATLLYSQYAKARRYRR